MAHVYILRCADGSYYVGSARNLEARMRQHGEGGGSAYTKSRMPVELVWAAETPRVTQAYAIERQIHGWSRAKKEALIRGDFDAIREPLQQIQNLRGMTPTAIVTKHLLNGDDSVIREMGDQVRSTADALNLRKAVDAAAPVAAPVASLEKAAPESPMPEQRAPTMPRMHKPLAPEERPPFDVDAT